MELNEEKQLYVDSARIYLYRVFARAFAAEADGDFLACLESGECAEAFDALLLGGEYGKIARRDLAGELDGLRATYARLFVGPGKPEASPWESLYRKEDGAIMGPTTCEVREQFRRLGLRAQGYPHVAEDHIALELGLMASMIERGCGHDEQRVFLCDHLLNWAGDFAVKVCAAAPGSLYAAIASALPRFLKIDRQIIAERAGESAV